MADRGRIVVTFKDEGGLPTVEIQGDITRYDKRPLDSALHKELMLFWAQQKHTADVEYKKKLADAEQEKANGGNDTRGTDGVPERPKESGSDKKADKPTVSPSVPSGRTG
jgi:hypothetical protein